MIKKCAGIIAVFVLGAVLVSGCIGARKADVKIGKDGIHVETGEGTVDITSGEGGSVKVTTKDGEVNVEISGEDEEVVIVSKTKSTTLKIAKDVDLKTLGVPVYLGAKVEAGATMNRAGGEATLYKNVVLITPDPVRKVVDFYRKNFEGATIVDMSATSGMVMFNKQEDNVVKSVVVAKDSKDTGKTIITITIAEQ